MQERLTHLRLQLVIQTYFAYVIPLFCFVAINNEPLQCENETSEPTILMVHLQEW